MDSIGATALSISILDNYFVDRDNSPVLIQKPFFFVTDPLDPVTGEIKEFVPDNSDGETGDEFKEKVKQRKLQGFIGNEYTLEEALSKQFGPEQIEARAFLEYYWEMKAKCLEAVEKKSNFEIESFQRHPLFSLDWLFPSRKDIRWYLKHEIGSEENKIVKEKKLNGSSQTLVKSSDCFGVDGSPVLSHKPILFATDPLDPVTEEIQECVPDNSDRETEEFKEQVKQRKLQGFIPTEPLVPVTDEIQECVPDNSAPEPEKEFKEKVKQRKLQGFIGNGYTLEEAMSKQFGPDQVEARAFIEYYWEMKAKGLEAVEQKREQIVRQNSSSIPYKRFPSNGDHVSSQYKPTERKKGMPFKGIRKPIVIRQNPSGLSPKRFAGTKNLGKSQLKPTESRKGYKMPITKIRKPVVISHKGFPTNGDREDSQRKRTENKNNSQVHLRNVGELVVRNKPSSVSFKPLLATRDLGEQQCKPNEKKTGSKIPVKMS